MALCKIYKIFKGYITELNTLKYESGKQITEFMDKIEKEFTFLTHPG